MTIEYQRAWHKAHPGYNAERRAANPDVHRAYDATYRDGHRSTVRLRTNGRRMRRLLMLQIIKQEMGCIDCGYNVNPAALDFDHVRGVKLFNIARGASFAILRLQTELAKCVVRCANCHRIRTYK